jgi:hypothetical protein
MLYNKMHFWMQIPSSHMKRRQNCFCRNFRGEREMNGRRGRA